MVVETQTTSSNPDAADARTPSPFPRESKPIDTQLQGNDVVINAASSMGRREFIEHLRKTEFGQEMEWSEAASDLMKVSQA